METVLITGGTGLIGKALTQFLTGRGYNVIILSRKAITNYSNIAPENVRFAKWDVKKKVMDITALQQADYIINLAGAGVMDKKWTAAYKNEIVNSRIESAALLVQSLQQNPNKVKAVISASAIGWYTAGNTMHTEEEEADKSFLGETCRLWEESIQPVTGLNKRLVTLRIGIVLSKNGGALKEFMQPIKYGIAAILGNGKQVLSWIYINDLCRIFLHAIENEKINGVYNAVAPHPITNKELTLALAKKMKGRYYLPVQIPSFILKLMLGERSIEILKGVLVSSKKIEASTFMFRFENIDAVLRDLTEKIKGQNG
jgi:uncharacterized protein (TIGR01777 family)